MSTNEMLQRGGTGDVKNEMMQKGGRCITTSKNETTLQRGLQRRVVAA